MATEKENLLALRTEIDEIDNSIQDLLQERARIVKKVSSVKKKY